MAPPPTRTPAARRIATTAPPRPCAHGPPAPHAVYVPRPESMTTRLSPSCTGGVQFTDPPSGGGVRFEDLGRVFGPTSKIITAHPSAPRSAFRYNKDRK